MPSWRWAPAAAARCARRCRRRCARARPQAAALRALLVPQAAGRVPRCRATSATTPTSTPRIHHATAVGRLFRPDNPLLPNYKWVPIGYHGRASSIGVSRPGRSSRPRGQTMPPGAARPSCGRRGGSTTSSSWACSSARGNALGSPRAAGARPRSTSSACACSTTGRRATSRPGNTSRWGRSSPKNFATTISPWIVTLEALAPFRVPWTRPAGDPQPLPYLDIAGERARRRARHPARGLASRRRAMRAAGVPAAAPVALQLPRRLLDRGADASRTTPSTAATCSPATCSAAARSPGRRPEEAGSLLELTAGRQAAADAAERRDPHLPRGRRPRHPARLVRARRAARASASARPRARCCRRQRLARLGAP